MKKILVGMFAVSAMPIAVAAETPFTAEVLLGKTTQSISFTDVNDVDDTSIAIRLGYGFSNSWAAEVAYYDYGAGSSRFIDSDGDLGKDTLTASSFLVGVKKEFKLNEKLSLNARVGLAFWDLEFKRDWDGPYITYKDSDSGNDLYYGAGLDYSMKENLLVSINYSFVSMGPYISDRDVDNDTSTVAVGLGYQF